MLLIVGLGNPGSEHAGNRHNVGFMIADAIHRRHGFGPWRRRFRGEVAEGTLGGAKVLLLKPLTYMNESGRSVGEAANFFKIDPADIVVIHDEVDLPPGKLRMKDGGGTAGHNGLRSIGGAIGPAFRRMRIGVGHPGVKEMVPIHVLHDFAKSDRIWLEPLVEAIADSAPELATGKDSTFANRVHEAIAPEKPAAKEKKAKPVKELPKKPESDPEPTAPAMKKSEPRAEGSLARGIKRLFGSRE